MKTTRWLRSMLALHRNVTMLSGTVFLLAGAWFSWYPLLPLHLRDLGATAVSRSGMVTGTIGQLPDRNN